MLNQAEHASLTKSSSTFISFYTQFLVKISFQNGILAIPLVQDNLVGG